MNFLQARRNPSLRIGAAIVALVLLCAVFAPLLAPRDPYLQNLDNILQPPNAAHLLGTDLYGRDVLSRLIYGTRSSLAVAMLASTIAVLSGLLIGLIAGFSGGIVDRILMRIVDVLLGFPRLFILLLALGFGYPSIWFIVIVLALFSWMEIARIVRGQVRVVREMLYVKAAQALGLSNAKIVRKYILPNVIGPVIVAAAMLIASMLIVESSLSFLGLGIQPPEASWGTILNQGRQYPVAAWWLSTFAGIMIVVTVLGFHLLGDGLRNYLDPKTRGQQAEK